MRVTACLRYEAGLFRGGGELQALDTVRELEALGCQANFYNVLDREIGDIAHFFGSMPYYNDLAQLLNRDHVPYVVSTIYVTRRTGLRLKTKSVLSRAQGAFPKHIARLYRGAKRLFTLSAFEEANIRTVFGDDLPPVRRIPIGVDSMFRNADPGAFTSVYGVAPFIFHCGSYSARKGQLNLIKASKGLGLRLVFVGQVHEQDYLERCRAEAPADTVFLTNLTKSDPMLSATYAAAELFCLPSEAEILSASALEAGVSGCRLVLSNTWGAEEYFKGDAAYVDPRSVASIRKGLELALRKEHLRSDQADRFYTEFKWDTVTRKILAEYEAVLSEAG